MKCEWPEGPYTTHCTAKLAGSPDSDKTVVLTNPDGRLRFEEDDTYSTTKELTLKQDGTPEDFEIIGESRSDSLDDAIIEAHLDTATGVLLGEEDATVFYFDNAGTRITVENAYSIYFDYDYYQYMLAPDPKPAVKFSASARIRPAGVNCSVSGATSSLKIEISLVQNLLSTYTTNTWDTPKIRWETGVPPGTEVKANKMFRIKLECNERRQDCADLHDPLYNQAAKGRPIGCPGWDAESEDSPAVTADEKCEIPAKTSDGTVVGIIVYTKRVNVTIDDEFVLWTVVYDSWDNEICALRQRYWGVHVDWAAGSGQTAYVASGDTSPTMVPKTGPPYANWIPLDPKYFTIGGIGEEITFIK